MSVELQIVLPAPEIPVLATLDVRVILRNTGALPLELPGENDRTPALTFDVYQRGTDKLVRRMNGFSHQALMLRTRIDGAHELEAVPGGGALDFTLDLAQFHQPLRVGEYEVQATYAYPPAEVNAASARVPLRVTDLRVTGMEAVRDNPVLDGLTVLVEAEDGTTWGRLHNPERPLAAWWNRPLGLPPGTRGAFCATSGFFTTESFGPFFSTYVVFQHGSYVVARHFAWGKPSGLQHAAVVPGRGRLIKSAIRTKARELLVFFWSDGLLEGYRLDPNALVKVMEKRLPTGLAGEPCVRADEEFLHVVYPDRGLVHEKVSLTGLPSSEQRVHESPHLPVQWVYDPAIRRLKAVFVDSRWGRALELVTSDPSGLVVEETQLVTRGHLAELSFDRNRGKTFILYSTSRRRLYLSITGRSPVLIASGQERYFPIMIADAAAYIGYSKPRFGHRFFTYTTHAHLPHIVDYETQAWERP